MMGSCSGTCGTGITAPWVLNISCCSVVVLDLGSISDAKMSNKSLDE